MKKLHKYLGLLMLAPLLLWVVTGFVFLTKPGYSAAYEQITPKLYPIHQPVHISGAEGWSQIRILRTVLGYHLLVFKSGQWRHLDPFTLKPRPQPTPEEIRVLVQDAIAKNADRYGFIAGVEDATVFTDTDIVISIDWDSLSFRQKGTDTRLIDTLYRIHYLQWFSSPTLNKILGFSGLFLLATLTLVGLTIFVGAKRNKST